MQKAARVGTIYDPTSGFDAWASDTIKRYILSNSKDPQLRRIGKRSITDQQKEAGVLLSDMFRTMAEDMEFNGLTRNDARLNKEISFFEKDILSIEDSVTKKTKLLADIEDTIKGQQGAGATAKQTKKMADLENEIASLRAKIIDNQGKINERQGLLGKGISKEDFIFPLFYNKELMDDAERQLLTDIFEGDFRLQRLAKGDTNIDNVKADAEVTLARIMEEDGEDFSVDFENVEAALQKKQKQNT